MRNSLDLVKFYHEKSVVKNNIDPNSATLDFNEALVVGEFVDIERPTFEDNYATINRRELGDWPNLERREVAEETKASG